MKPDDISIKSIKGIGDAKAKQLLRLGISSIWDLLTYYPIRFEDRRNVKSIFSLQDDETVCITAIAATPVTEHYVRKGMTYYKITVRDDSGFLTCIFFNNKYIKNMIHTGYEYSFYGKVRMRCGKPEMLSPEFEPSSENRCTKSIIPVYALTNGITQNFLRTIIREAYNTYSSEISDILPSKILSAHTLCSIGFAIKNIHFPTDTESIIIAKKRLVFEEFFLFQTALRRLKTDIDIKNGIKMKTTDISEFTSALAFSFTDAQTRVVNEIISDLSGGFMMNRLVQGDVGSGKTAVSAAAIYCCCHSGYQAAMMVPTEVLAVQHYNDLHHLFENLGIKSALLTGSTPAKDKRAIYAGLSDGSIDVIFGTHALITDKVHFSRLALAVTDEQHRFGVRQRMLLSEKGEAVHTLVMTATPIPRTLALIMYGDMDISIIDELPPGRQKIDTFCVGEDMRSRIYAFIRREAESGNRCYIVCPAVDESENETLKSVTEYYSHLSNSIFNDIPMGFVHGKMKASDKESAMNDFISGMTSILVSTTVIEVGVNVPEATIMLIENAERFGLSQLHQLRGRVGRGKSKSYCILMCTSFSNEIKERMRIMTQSNDGFKIAEKDLAMRGPGEFFGTLQHGMLNFRIADLAEDIEVLKESGEAAEKLLKDDPTLSLSEHFYIRNATDKLTKSLSL